MGNGVVFREFPGKPNGKTQPPQKIALSFTGTLYLSARSGTKWLEGLNESQTPGRSLYLAKWNTPPKFNSSPLKNGGWKTILSYWEGNSSGAMLNFGRVIFHQPRFP